MAAPTRNPEATQEIDARDVLEVSDLRRTDPASSPSIRPVGVDIELAAARRGYSGLKASIEDIANSVSGPGEETCQIRLSARRRELSRYVIGAVAISCAILMASVVKHKADAHAHDEAPQARGTTTGSVAATRTAPSPPRLAADIPPPPAVPVKPIPALPGAVPVAETSSGSGTLRFAPPAKAGWIWLDGKRLTGTSAIVSCGTHQVKVGYYAKHSVVVPCDAEVVLSH